VYAQVGKAAEARRLCVGGLAGLFHALICAQVLDGLFVKGNLSFGPGNVVVGVLHKG
jgi:hypothetical protein